MRASQLGNRILLVLLFVNLSVQSPSTCSSQHKLFLVPDCRIYVEFRTSTYYPGIFLVEVPSLVFTDSRFSYRSVTHEYN